MGFSKGWIFLKVMFCQKYSKNSNLYQILKIFAHTFVHLKLKKLLKSNEFWNNCVVKKLVYIADQKVMGFLKKNGKKRISKYYF